MSRLTRGNGMKIKSEFVTHELDGVQFLISMDQSAFRGFMRSNETAAFIVEQLKTETTKDQIVDAMEAVYDAPRAQIAADVDEILDKLRSMNALEE